MKLTMAVYGFFVYPMSGDDCLGLIAPKVDATAPHRCDLLIQGTLVSEPPAGLRPYVHKGKTRARGSMLPLADVDVQLGGGKAAAAASFDLIQPMDSIICGLDLPANYRESDAVLVGVDFAGGTITALPDTYTARGEWTWDDCGGRSITMRLTSYTVYETDEFDGTITLRSRNGLAATRLTFSGDQVQLALRYGLAEKKEIRAVNQSHVEASRRLCDAPAAMPQKAKERRIAAQLTAWAGLDDLRRDFLNGLDRPTPAEYAFEGDPHCSARMIQVAHVVQGPVQQTGA